MVSKTIIIAMWIIVACFWIISAILNILYRGGIIRVYTPYFDMVGIVLSVIVIICGLFFLKSAKANV